MTWLLLAFLSAMLLGCYDVCKKQALVANAVFPVLLFKTLLCTLMAAAVAAATSPESLALPTAAGGNLDTHTDGSLAMLLVMGKSVLVLTSWICGYIAMKYLPITLVGPVNATRPVLVLVGALVIYGEALNLWQWAGVVLAFVAFFMLKRSSKSELRSTEARTLTIGKRTFSASSVLFMLLIMAALMGAASGLYDKYLLSPSGAGLDRLFVQTYFNAGQFVLMLLITALAWWPKRKESAFRWRWGIVGVSVFLTAADMVYFYALTYPAAMISVVSMVRRSSVLVSFAYGAFVLREKNLRSKAIDLVLLLLSLICLALGAE